jgi:hypothetical protein
MKSKSLFLALLLPLFLFTACQQSPEKPVQEPDGVPVVDVNHEEAPAVTTLNWDATSFSFGQVPQGGPARHRFTFTNTGTADLIIENVKPTCSCTVADYSKEPVKPGEQGFVEGEYNAKAVGIFQKSLTVTANTEPKTVVLSLSGEVVE